ncbi:hypothetical protein F4809DRAFT_255380 [Biscogniauxia mediterranea]|nr:hypothetical protein F4809DRAFT_255380 [Biscogniauxia mediterranea]
MAVVNRGKKKGGRGGGARGGKEKRGVFFVSQIIMITTRLHTYNIRSLRLSSHLSRFSPSLFFLPHYITIIYLPTNYIVNQVLIPNTSFFLAFFLFSFSFYSFLHFLSTYFNTIRMTTSIQCRFGLHLAGEVLYAEFITNQVSVARRQAIDPVIPVFPYQNPRGYIDSYVLLK